MNERITHEDARDYIRRVLADGGDPWPLGRLLIYIEEQERHDLVSGRVSQLSDENSAALRRLAELPEFKDSLEVGAPLATVVPLVLAALADLRMQRDVLQEKLNEYIEKAKEAEREVARLKNWVRIHGRVAYEALRASVDTTGQRDAAPALNAALALSSLLADAHQN